MSSDDGTIPARGIITRRKPGEKPPPKQLATQSRAPRQHDQRDLPPARAKQPVPSPTRNSNDSSSEEEGSQDPLQTDPRLVKGPVVELVHTSLAGLRWRLLPHLQMCVRFDAVNPLMQFKRGVKRNPKAGVPFPRYNPSPEEDPDVTEDDPEVGLEQYEPVLPERCVPPAAPTHTTPLTQSVFA